MNSADLMHKASRAAASARLLLDSGDVEGACNRAYYAMFDAAQAALIESKTESDGERPKTHSGLISEFSRRLIKSGELPFEIGRAFNRVSEIRLVADYTNDTVPIDKAEWALHQAVTFIDSIRARYKLP